MRVLIVDPNPHSARMLTEIIKGLGANEIVTEPNNDRALRAAADRHGAWTGGATQAFVGRRAQC